MPSFITRACLTAAALAAFVLATGAALADNGNQVAEIEMFAPEDGHRVGLGGGSRDLKEFGVVSNIAKARFFINP